MPKVFIESIIINMDIKHYKLEQYNNNSTIYIKSCKIKKKKKRVVFFAKMYLVLKGWLWGK